MLHKQKYYQLQTILRSSTLAVLLCLGVSAHAQNIVVKGTVVDSSTNEPLRLATVRLLEYKRGTFTSRTGDFIFKNVVARDTITVVTSMVGYRPDTLQLFGKLVYDTSVKINLAERAFRASEIVVTAEDPAVRIMRQVLEKKAAQEERLQSYSYTLYTKFVATTDTSTAMRSSGRGDTTVFSILESFSKGYFQRPDKYFNEILHRRQTANIPAQANFVAFGTNLNVYMDYVTLLNEEIASPFSKDGLDIYNYELASSEDEDIVQIRVHPKGSARKAFTGDVFIDQRKKIPLEARLTPNKVVSLPFDAQLTYRQTFSEESGAVMPEALAITSSVQADILFIISPRLDISIETYCDDYQLNPDIDPEVFEQRRVEIAQTADTYDSVFWQSHQKLPLKPEEQQAYADIQYLQDNPDSVQSSFFDSFLGPITRTIARLGRRPFTGFEDVLRYNSIHGLFLGVGLRFRPDTALEISATSGYGTADQHWYGSLKTEYFPDKLQKWSIDFGVGRGLARRDDPNILRSGVITFSSMLFGNDPGDYYYNEGWFAGIKYSWGQLRFLRNDIFGRLSGLRIGVVSERQTTAITHDTWYLFGNSNKRRQNPAIFHGSLQAVVAELHLQYSPVRQISRTGMSLTMEYSNPSVLPSDFEYFWMNWKGLVRMHTLPLWTLDIAASVGYTDGNVPPQRFYSIESAVSGLAFPGTLRGLGTKEFYGNRYAAVTVSHNFGEVIPGILRIPNIASFGIEFIGYSSIAYSTFTNTTVAFTQTTLPTISQTPEQLYYEVGIGINRILLFFRFDINARLSQRNNPQFWFTLSAATF